MPTRFQGMVRIFAWATLFKTNNKLTVSHPVNQDDAELPHMNFMTAFGDRILSLKLKDISSIFPYLVDEDDTLSPPIMQSVRNLGWIYKTIQVCSLLQELATIDPVYEDLHCIIYTWYLIVTPLSRL